MKVTLNEQEIMRAIIVYMALKGIKTGDYFEFKREEHYKVGHKNSVSFDAIPAKYNLEKIVEFANKELKG